MLNRSASLAMSTSVLKALSGKLDIKRHSSSGAEDTERGISFGSKSELDQEMP